MALTPEKREQIRLEEEYRHEVRSALAEKDKPKESRLWKFLNSGFGLWLCSAVILSGGTFIYTQYSEAREAEEKRQKAVEALDLEIAYRLSNALAKLGLAQLEYDDNLHDKSKSPQETLNQQRQQTIAAAHQLYYAPAGTFPPLYPEYAKYGLPTLITELRRNERDVKALKALQGVLRNVMADAADETAELPPKNWIERIRQRYVLPRWEHDFNVGDPLAER